MSCSITNSKAWRTAGIRRGKMSDRNIGEVLEQMLAIEEIPEPLKESLTKFGSDLRYRAPEEINRSWGELGHICSAAVENRPPEKLVGWERGLIGLLINEKL
jgi:hypothetical protein